MRFFAGFCVLSLLALAGCMGPVSLHKAVLGYDESVSRVERELLLLNIARKYHSLPGHFTVTSSIAATFNYQTSVGFDAGLFNGPDSINAYNPNIGVSVAENPTLSIIPIQGEEFTKRILRPMPESVFLFLVFQGLPIDMVMRLMGRGIEAQNPDGSFHHFLLNWPDHPKEYEVFRKVALHLAWLNSERKLFVGKIYFDEVVYTDLKGPPPIRDLVKAFEEGYRCRPLKSPETFEVVKSKIGRVAITNYDLETLTNNEREALNERASTNPDNFVFIDIKPGHPGGDFPIFGAIKLRSLDEILAFVAMGITPSSEYDVGPDPRTLRVDRNPVKTLSIELEERKLPDRIISVQFQGDYYHIKDTPWDLKAFNILYNLFQATVTQVSGIGVPFITISK